MLRHKILPLGNYNIQTGTSCSKIKCVKSKFETVDDTLLKCLPRSVSLISSYLVPIFCVLAFDQVLKCSGAELKPSLGFCSFYVKICFTEENKRIPTARHDIPCLNRAYENTVEPYHENRLIGQENIHCTA